MPKKKPRATDRPPDIETKTSKILVAKSRSVEPYFHLFSVSPENVAQDPLGRIMGVVSISDRSDSSSYVGNIVASVAKKEYYANLRRDPTLSFETTLNRTNIALSELVRNGETGFMGHLNGAIASISENEIRFSATGQAAIFLYRDGVLTDISEGLASEEAETHPLKTFTEISSGRLLPGDCVLLVTPELFSVLSPQELGRNAKRLIPKGSFTRFLETAMINELKGAAALVVSVSEKAERPAPVAKKKRNVRTGVGKGKNVKVPNVWGETTWRKNEVEQAGIELRDDHGEPESVEETPKTDDRQSPVAGAIYVDGESAPEKEEHPLLTEARWKFEEWSTLFRSHLSSFSVSFRAFAERFSHSAGIVIENVARNLGKTASGAARRATKYLSRKATDAIRKRRNVTRGKTMPKQPDREVSRRGDDNPILARAIATTGKRSETKASSAHRRNPPATGRNGRSLSGMFRIVGETFRKARTAASRTDIARRLPRPDRRSMIIVAILAFVATLSIAGIRRASRDATEPLTKEETPVIVIEEPEADPRLPADEPEAVAAATRTIMSNPGDAIAPIYLDGKPFIVTRSGIVDGETGDSSEMPEDSPVAFATAMDDLSLIFLLTESGKLFSYAPSNGVFSENTLPMPQDVDPVGIASYLTYLYLLDGGAGTVYRFPRIEGGFDEPKTWTSTGVGTGSASIAVNGSVYIASDSEVISLFQGKPSEDFTLESPKIPLTATTLCAHEEAPERFVVLDTAAKRVLLYDANGSIIRQYFNESFSSMTACSLNESGTEVSVSSPNSIYVFSLKE